METCPAPHGAGGLKLNVNGQCILQRGPAPHGAGGLKSNYMLSNNKNTESRPARGGWIEMRKI